MAYKTLLIPGTGGCKLLKKDGTTLGHPVVLNAKVWLINAIGANDHKTVKLLSMAHEPGEAAPKETSLEAGTEIKPGPCLEVAYNQVLPWVDAQFVYDWRGDLVYNADRLLDFMMDPANKPDGTKWRIVCHSQGGLLALIASQRLAERTNGSASAFSKLASHLCMVAPPVAGTLNSAHALLVGEQLSSNSTRSFRKIAGSWPALYQMLPDWLAIKTPTGDFSQFGFFHTQLYTPFDWIDRALVKRAWQVRKKYLRWRVRKLQKVKYSYILTRNEDTWDRVIRDMHGQITFPAKDREGDSLVPFRATHEKVMSGVEQNRTDAVGPFENVSEHSMLLNDDFVVSLVKKRLDL